MSRGGTTLPTAADCDFPGLGCGIGGPNFVVVGLRTGAAGLVGRGMVQVKLGDVGIRVEQEQVDRQLRLPEGLDPRHKDLNLQPRSPRTEQAERA